MSREPTNADATGEAELFWEQHYRRRERVWSGRANAVLVDVVAPLPARTALDLGCGEGGDAVWLAQRGWRVTAVDLSAIALNRAAAYAAEAGVEDRVDFQRHDLTATFPVGTFDLVSAQYLQSPVEFPRSRVLRAAAGAVAVDGLLLIVEHATAPPWASDHATHTRFPTEEGTLGSLELQEAQWRIERLGSPQRSAIGPNGESGTVADNVIAVRRLAQ
jgi:SAM-dependent methyltransferase